MVIIKLGKTHPGQFRPLSTSITIMFTIQNTNRLPGSILTFSFLLPALFSLCLVSAASLAQAAQQAAVLGTQGNISKYKRFPESQGLVFENQKVKKRISAKSAIVIDPARQLVFFAKNPDSPRQPASTIKILTGTIALRSLTGEEPVPVSRNAAGRPSSKMYLDPKKSYSADELISGVLLASANDASVALAELIAGSEDSFAEMMTLQARVWGATNTLCKTATGLTAKGQTSSARDLALILNEAMKNEEFAERIKKRAMQTAEGNKFYNHNKALWQITGTQGGKTGYTNAARQTYVGKFKRGNSEIVVAILGSETMWNDLKTLVRFGFKQYQYIPSQPGKQEVEKNKLLASVK